MTDLTALVRRRKLGFGANKSAKRRVWFNMLLISLVIAVLILAQIFVVSMSRGIADRWAYLADGHLQLYLRPGQLSPTDSRILDQQRVGEVNALLYSPEGNKIVRVKGVTDSYFTAERRSQLTIEVDADLPSSTLPAIVVSRTLADELSLTIGDRLALMLVSEDAIRAQLCYIESIYDSGYRELDEALIFCDIAFLIRLFDTAIDEHWELITGPKELDSVQQDLRSQGYVLSSWEEQAPALSANLKTSREAVLGVMIVVALLCGYFISELSAQMVEDDKIRIATLRLIGSLGPPIRRAYFQAVLTITAVSLIIGSMLGIGFAYALPPVLALLAQRSFVALSFYLLDFPISIPFGDLLIIQGMLLLASIVSVNHSLKRVDAIEAISAVRFD